MTQAGGGNLGELNVKLTGDNTDLTSSLNEAEQAVESAATNIDASAQKAGRSIGGMGRAAEAAASSFRKMIGAITGTLGAITALIGLVTGLIAVIRGLVDRLNEKNAALEQGQHLAKLYEDAISRMASRVSAAVGEMGAESLRQFDAQIQKTKAELDDARKKLEAFQSVEGRNPRVIEHLSKEVSNLVATLNSLEEGRQRVISSAMDAEAAAAAEAAEAARDINGLINERIRRLDDELKLRRQLAGEAEAIRRGLIEDPVERELANYQARIEELQRLQQDIGPQFREEIRGIIDALDEQTRETVAGIIDAEKERNRLADERRRKDEESERKRNEDFARTIEQAMDSVRRQFDSLDGVVGRLADTIEFHRRTGPRGPGFTP